MDAQPGRCPLTGAQLVDRYFIENRTRLLEIAGFLDRLERASDGAGHDDYRIRAFKEALARLSEDAPDRALAVQMILSDPRESLLDELDQKSANGAYDRWQVEVK